MVIWLYILIGIVVIWFLAGIRIIRPTQRGALETLGKYKGFKTPGFNWVAVPFQKIIYVNVTERMADVEPQEIITSDNLNAGVDLVVYYKVRPDQENVKRSLYQVHNFKNQIVTLAQTTARNVIGGMKFKEVNSKRNDLNDKLRDILDKESDAWGVQVVRVELKEIQPPKDVQETMNKIIKAENEKTAAIDFAQARETEADGIKRASIKEAEGQKRSTVLEAEGIAEAKKVVADAESYRIKMVNQSAQQYFKGNAQTLKKLQVTEASLKNNSKIILSEKGINPTLLVGELPLVNKDKEE